MVDRDGLYQLDYASLHGAGVPVDTLDPRSLKLHNQGTELAIQVTGEDDGVFDTGDALRFYGQQMDTRFTETNVYWLTWEGTAGLRMTTRNAVPLSAPSPTSFTTTVHIEENHAYRSRIPSGEAHGDHWFWKYLQATSIPVTDTFSISLNFPTTEPHIATIRGHLYGYSAFGPTPDHHTRVFLNGHLVDDATWDGWREYTFENAIPSAYLLDGENLIDLVLPFDLGPSVINDVVFVNWFEIDYRQAFTATNDLLDFSLHTPGTWKLQARGFTTETLSAFDITTPTLPIRILNASAALDGDSYTLSFQDTITDAQRFLTLAPSQILSPTAVFSDTPSTLRNPSNGADYLIISHSDFVTAALPLADFRAAQGLRTQVVDVQDVYDEFSDGIFDPQAIHDFLAYAYDNWALPAPAYVLLVGDGHLDFKNHSGFGETMRIPPWLAYIDPWMGETAADNRYVTVAGDDILPDMHLGRLPVKTPAEAAALVTKILAYEQSPPSGDWNQYLTFVADNPDDAGEFYDLSDAIADNFVPAPYITDTIYYQQPYSSGSAVKSALLGAINNGRLIVHYTGHATQQFWGFEHFFDIADIAGLTNAGMQPLVLPMTCLDGYYISPSTAAGYDFSSVGEAIVRASGKGAIASWSPTGFGIATGHHFLAEGLYTALFQDNTPQLGPATLSAKFHLFSTTAAYPELLDTYTLFGDPATMLNVAFGPNSVQVSEFSAFSPWLGFVAGLTLLTSAIVILRRWRRI